MERKKRWIKLLIALACIAIVGVWFRQCVQIDGCLDHGGRWNYQEGWCEP
jgi:hypothetical protein